MCQVLWICALDEFGFFSREVAPLDSPSLDLLSVGNVFLADKLTSLTVSPEGGKLVSLAGVDCFSVETEYAGHARQYIEDLRLQDLQSYHGILAVGLHAFLHGLSRD